MFNNLVGRENLVSIIRSVALLAAVLAIGVTGYSVLEGWSFLNSLYMTVITIATVGYREAEQPSDAGKIFTIVLIFISFGIFAYVITSFTRFLLDGVLRQQLIFLE